MFVLPTVKFMSSSVQNKCFLSRTIKYKYNKTDHCSKITCKRCLLCTYFYFYSFFNEVLKLYLKHYKYDDYLMNIIRNNNLNNNNNDDDHNFDLIFKTLLY